MKETTPSAMPPCFDRWCKRFDDLLSHQAQKREFRNYIGELLGESERKNLSQMAGNAVGVEYHRLHHFLSVLCVHFYPLAHLNRRIKKKVGDQTFKDFCRSFICLSDSHILSICLVAQSKLGRVYCLQKEFGLCLGLIFV